MMLRESKGWLIDESGLYTFKGNATLSRFEIQPFNPKNTSGLQIDYEAENILLCQRSLEIRIKGACNFKEKPYSGKFYMSPWNFISDSEIQKYHFEEKLQELCEKFIDFKYVLNPLPYNLTNTFLKLESEALLKRAIFCIDDYTAKNYKNFREQGIKIHLNPGNF